MSISPTDDRILNQLETAQACGFSLATLRRLENAGKGPPVTRLSERRKGYRFSKLRAWLDARTEQTAA
jgi:predicted DNA-binding transcriptional regulator AlpA